MKISYQQARAILAHTAVKHYTREQLAERLHRIDPHVQVADRSPLSIAYMLAWKLMPAERRAP